MANPKRYAEKIKRKNGKSDSGLQIPKGSYNMMEGLSIIKPLFEPHFKSHLGGGFEIKTKLEISHPMDESEMQADELADSFMQGDAEHSQEILSRQVSEISRSAEGMQTSDAFDQQLQSSKGQGRKLDEGIKSELEEHTGTDLSDVNIHTNSQAHDMSESINAKAFAHGQDIYFKEGNYNPQSEQGKSLLAHEVAHTVQQGEGKLQPQINRFDNDDDGENFIGFEAEFWGDRFHFQHQVNSQHYGPDNDICMYKIEYKGDDAQQITKVEDIELSLWDKIFDDGFGARIKSEYEEVQKQYPYHSMEDIFNYVQYLPGSLRDRNDNINKLFAPPFSAEVTGQTRSTAIMKCEVCGDYIITDKIHYVNASDGSLYKVHRFSIIYQGIDQIGEKNIAWMNSTGYLILKFADNKTQSTQSPDLIKDFPASLPRFEGVPYYEPWYYTLIDADGDEQKEMLIQVKENYSSKSTESKFEFTFTNINTNEKAVKTFTIPGYNNNKQILDLWFRNRTEGIYATEYDILLRSMINDQTTNAGSFLIDPPVVEKDKATYNITFGKNKESFVFGAPKAAKLNNFILDDSGQYDNKLFFDVELGLYKDKFRFTLDHISGGEHSILNVVCFTGNSIIQTYETAEVPVAPPYNLVVRDDHRNNLENSSLVLSFNGGVNKEMEIFDRLSVTLPGDKDAGSQYMIPLENQTSDKIRFHSIRVITYSSTGQEEKVSQYTFKIVNDNIDKNKVQTMQELAFYAQFELPSLLKHDPNEPGFNLFVDMSITLASIESLKSKLLKDGVIDMSTYTAWMDLAFAATDVYPVIAQHKRDGEKETKYEKALDDFWHTLANEEVKKGLKSWFSGERDKRPTPDPNSSVNDYFDPYFVYGSYYADFLRDQLNKTHPYDSQYEGYSKTLGYHSAKLLKLSDLRDKNLQKAKAYHFPLNVETPAGKKVTSVPLELYYWADGDKWYLIDLTGPRPNEGDFYQTSYEKKSGELLPPKELFANLNYSKCFVEGLLYVQLPGQTFAFEIQTEQKLTVTDYLTYIALALLALGLLLSGVGVVFEGFAFAAAAELGASFAFAAAEVTFGVAAIATMMDSKKRGTLTTSQVLINVALIVASFVGAAKSAAGGILNYLNRTSKIVFGPLATGVKLLRTNYQVLTGMSKAADTAVLLLFAEETSEKIYTTLNSQPPSGERDRALAGLFLQLFAAGLIHVTVLKRGQDAIEEGTDLVFYEVNGVPLAASVNKSLKGKLDDILLKTGDQTLIPALMARLSNTKQLELFIDSIGDVTHINRLLTEAGSPALLSNLVESLNGLPQPIFQQFSFKQLQSMEIELQKWNIGSKGINQGIEHIYQYAFGVGGTAKENRLKILEDYYGGNFSVNDAQLVEKVNDALADMISKPPISPLGTMPKQIYFYPKNGIPMPIDGFSNNQKGIAIFTYDNKYASYMNSSYKDFKSKK
jgi:hypothetical protein